MDNVAYINVYNIQINKNNSKHLRLVCKKNHWFEITIMMFVILIQSDVNCNIINIMPRPFDQIIKGVR